MKRLMEVYDLSIDLEMQLSEKRAMHLPGLNPSEGSKPELPQRIQLIKAVDAFSGAMLAKLEKNADKGHWGDATIATLFYRLIEEVGELSKAIERGEGRDAVRNEAVDVANFAMMIHDNLKG